MSLPIVVIPKKRVRQVKNPNLFPGGGELPVVVKKTNWSNELTDFGTRMLNAVGTFGGSAIGDAVNAISPKTADFIQKYSDGIIPHTSQEQLESNRSSNSNRWNNRIGQTASSVGNILSGEMIGAAMSKAAPYAVNTLINTSKDNLRKIVYNNVTPIGYSGKMKEFGNVLKDVVTAKDNSLMQNPRRRHPDMLGYNLPQEIAESNRNAGWRKYLGVGDKGDELYIKNSNGTYRYNNDKISNDARENFLNQYFEEGKDFLTSNAGGVGKINVVESNLPDVKFAKMRDVFDLNPFSNPNQFLFSNTPVLRDVFTKKGGAPDGVTFGGVNDRVFRKWVPNKLKNMEMGEFTGLGKPFTVEHSVPFEYKIPSDFNPGDVKTFLRKMPFDTSKKIVYEKQTYKDILKDINKNNTINEYTKDMLYSKKPNK